ncbi:hypothetical protein QWY31_02940 [Cytophagales bacterium LB-30]|uniref:Uncharacterized protein n=1 Tax=Shiella aurantiaca TaxID=3058365 RepID=A0ABT8F243_9BACT|nr:hypothetical protein [Shiella aurantiaca]MDN4164438.1 hypothetical protein [Shiella aurantiaca]
MSDFDSLKNIWQQEKPEAKPIPISAQAKSERSKMQRQFLVGSLLLFLTGIFIGAMALGLDLNFQQWYTYAAMGLVIAICWGQSFLIFSNYLSMRKIDESAAPGEHLKQWERYYHLRQSQNRWNTPLYFIMLNAAMGIYFIEIMSGRPWMNVAIVLGIYLAWVLYAYFVLGKKVLRKENQRLQTIIQELKALENQFEKE